MSVLLGEHPELADTAFGQEGGPGTLGSMHVNANDLGATITEYTCVCVFMITICNPKLKDPGQAGQSVRTAVTRALSTFKENRKTNTFNDKVSEIGESLNKAVEHIK